MTTRPATLARSRYAARRRELQRQARELAVRYDYDPVRLERHARLIEALDPDVAEAVLSLKVRGRRAA